MRSIELFAGAGGLALGVSRAGFTAAAVIERDRFCCATIRRNQKAGLEPVTAWPLIEGDVRDVDFDAIAGPVTLISGGPPCQPFSLGGRHRGQGDRRDMFPEAIRAVRARRPACFLFENVKGLIRPAFSHYFSYIQAQLTWPEVIRGADEDWTDHLARLKRHAAAGGGGLRYRVVARLLNAADFGVAQRRERVFLVGFRDDLGLTWPAPEPTHDRDALLWAQWRSGVYWDRHAMVPPDDPQARGRALTLTEQPARQPWRTVRDALHGLPDPEHRPDAAAAVTDHRFQPGARAYPGHSGSALDAPAKTLKAGAHGVPGGENMLRRPDGSIRYFTVRESARLQSFPDSFRLHGSWTETMRQLGNAVPVDLAAVVAGGVRRRLLAAGVT